MKTHAILQYFDERKPLIKQEIKSALNIENEHTFNQTLSYLVSFGILKRLENGLYYVPSSQEKFSQLKPSLSEIVHKKYLENHQGIRTGAYLLYKYKFTTQVSAYYEVLTNKVSKHTRSKSFYDGKVIVSYPPFELSPDNDKVLEFLELIKHLYQNNYAVENTTVQLLDIFKKNRLKQDEIFLWSEYYKGKRNAGFRATVKRLFTHDFASLPKTV
jgi:hypothetical protein